MAKRLKGGAAWGLKQAKAVHLLVSFAIFRQEAYELLDLVMNMIHKDFRQVCLRCMQCMLHP